MAWYKSQKNQTKLVIASWANGTDEEIVNMVKAHYAGKINLHDYWTVGDERVVNLSAMPALPPLTDTHVQQNVTLVLSEEGGKYLSDGVTECAFQVDAKDCIDKTSRINYTATNLGGWKESQRRAWCNSIYINAYPSTLKPIFKAFINQSGLGGGSTSGVENTVDYFALRAEIEVLGTTTKSVTGEGTQIEYYKTTSNQYKTDDGDHSGWWLRSPSSRNDRWCFVYTTYGPQILDPYSTAYHGLAPFGVI